MDLTFIWNNLGYFSAILLSLTFGTTFVNVVIFRFLLQPWPAACLSGVISAQMEEFSFLLISFGEELSILNKGQRQLLRTFTNISLAIITLRVTFDQSSEAIRVLHECTVHGFSRGILRRFFIIYYWIKNNSIITNIIGNKFHVLDSCA
jgi:Kef-type K+ transport system membrane component KefB